MFKHILVPLDGSFLAEAALAPALALAAKFGSEITLLRVTSMSTVYYADPYGGGAALLVEMRRQARKETADYLKARKGELRQQGYIVHTQAMEGESPADAILDVAESQNVDTIVMSTHGRGGLARWVYGSVADKVLRHAEVPILLVRAKEGMVEEKAAEAKAEVKPIIEPAF